MATFESIEQELKSFIGRHDRATAETKSRLLALEQRATAPAGLGDDTGSESKTIAPRDRQSGMPILTKSHKFGDNLPAGYEKRGLDFGKMLKGMVTGNWSEAGEERKALSEASGGAGGYLLPTEVAAQWIDFARANSVCVAAGARSLPMGGSQLRIPVLSTDVVCTWKQEMADVQEVSPALDKVDATAHTLAGELIVSMELFEDAPMIGDIVQSAFSRSMGQQLDAAALTGSASYGPVGLLTNCLVHQTPATAGTLAFDEISHAIQSIANRNYSANAYIVGPDGDGGLNRTKASTAGTYLDPPADVARLSRYVTTATDNDVFVGDFTKLYFFPRTDVRIELSRTAGDAWGKLGIAIRAYLRADVTATEPNAFQVITNYGS